MRKYYDMAVAPAGGPGPGDPPKAPTAPAGYAVTTPQKRTEWNGFLDYLDKQGVAGQPTLDQQGAGLKYFQQYKKANPNVSLTPDDVQNIQYEQYQLRKGDQFSSLNQMQLDHLRSGLAPAYLNRPLSDVNGQINSATSKLYYPAGKSYGTDIEHYDSALGQPAAASAAPATGPAKPVAGAIPPPDYSDPSSRLQYAKQWAQKYGPLMQGRGDTPLRINETPYGASDTAKNISTNAAKKVGLDPALLYSSAMEEGMSGLFVDKQGNAKGVSDDEKYPIQGSAALGLDQIVSAVPGLIKKGYLPADFQNQYTRYKPTDPNETDNSANFKTLEAGLAAKAAYLKDNYDSVDAQAKKAGVTLSPKARDFFSLVAYNAGTGTSQKMMADYNANGLLKDDKFTEERPTSGNGLKASSYKAVWENVARRTKMADALKQEGLFQ